MNRRNRIIRFVLAGIVAVALIWQVGEFVEPHLGRIDAWLDGLGAWAPLGYLLAYVLLVPAFFPESVLLAATGAAFGLIEGTGIAIAGVALSATLMFLLARSALAATVERWMAARPRFDAIRSALSKQSLRVFMLLRLAPLPFAPVSYAIASIGVGLPAYLLACVGRLPEIVMTIYLGAAARQLARISGGAAEPALSSDLPLAVGAVVSAVVVLLLARVARNALRESGVYL